MTTTTNKQLALVNGYILKTLKINMAKDQNWLTKQAFRKWMKQENGVEVTRQRLFNWIKRDQIKSKTVYGDVVLVDKTSLKVDLDWGKKEDVAEK